jgi:hypothetical protein
MIDEIYCLILHCLSVLEDGYKGIKKFKYQNL